MTESEDSLVHYYGHEYVDKFEKKPLFRVSRLMKYVELPEDSNVADFGCGNGLLLTCLHNKVRTYFGVDFSEFFIDAAKKRQKILGIVNAEFYCESIESFCSRNGEKFDAGFVLDLAEHVPDKEWIRILKAIRNSLKPSGKVYLHTPNADFFVETMKKRKIIFHQFKEHVAVRTIGENIRMLEHAGFSEFEIKMLPHYNLSRYLNFFTILPFIGKYLEARIFIIAKK
jgi:2-polyprenyl-6-hydroxyphenyl methylase/3-demethylubiquinone-9 3-methyltransferase